MRTEAHPGTWLCPTPFDRTRLLEAEASLSAVRLVAYALLGVAIAIWTPAADSLVLLAMAGSAVVLTRLHLGLARAARPEYLVAAMVVLIEVEVGVLVAITGGPDSPALLLAALPVAMLPASFGRAGVRAGVGVALAVTAAATFGVDAAAVVAHPAHVAVIAGAILGLGFFGDALGRGNVEHRMAGELDALRASRAGAPWTATSRGWPARPRSRAPRRHRAARDRRLAGRRRRLRARDRRRRPATPRTVARQPAPVRGPLPHRAERVSRRPARR